MKNDSGYLSIDFLAGFTIFIIAFIWVVSLIPGLLIGLQAYTIDYDAVAYRTGVILVEDPGEPALPQVPWELNDKRDVVRFGLAISRDTPNILSQSKVDRFFCSTFSYPTDYQKRAIFGDYPYRFNISLWDINEDTTYFVGDSLSGSYGTIRRLVQIKGISNATINASEPRFANFLNGENETQHDFTILINNTELLEGKVQNPAYQIDPARERIIVNITDFKSTMNPDRQECFNVSLTKIYAKDENKIPIKLFYDPVIDGIPHHAETESEYASLPWVNDNLSLVFEPSYLPWSNYPEVYVGLSFNLVQNYTECGATLFSGPDPVLGSRFLNNTYTPPFDYNYDPANVTQPTLRDAVVRVDVGSGYRAETGTLVESLVADFEYVLSGGTTVTFSDTSTGSPVEWKWEYEYPSGTWNEFGTSNIQSNNFPSEGTFNVRMTVTDNDGNTDDITKSVSIQKPTAAFSASPLSGGEPLLVFFTDSSTNVPTEWKWEYNSGSGWTQFSTVKNPVRSFPTGTYDIRLTATNAIGSDTLTKLAYITVYPLPAVDFSGSPTSGVLSLPVQFTDATTNSPTSWKWEYNTTPGGGWTQFSTAQNPLWTFTTGKYDIRLTATNAGGSNTTTKAGYITVTAAPMFHTITATSGAGGTITPSGAVSVNDGGSQTFAIAPNSGYHIVSVIVDTVSQGAIASYTFTSVIGDHTISATFAANTPNTLYYNGFNTSTSLNDWSVTGGGAVTRYTGGSSNNPASGFRNGTSSVRIISAGQMVKNFPTTGYTNIIVAFAMGASSLESSGWPSYTPEYVEASWYDGSSWTTLKQIDQSDPGYNGHLNYYSYSLPAAANNNANFRVRFRLSSGSGSSDYGYVDDVWIRGTAI